LAFALLAPTLADAAVYYLRSTVGAPWSQNTNETSMNTVFGTGNWIDERYETVSVPALLSPATTFMEGGDSNADELNAFLTANAAAITNWVTAGGRLFVNAAPNEGGNINFLFGVTLVYPDQSNTGDAINAANPIFNGPYVPAGTAYTGNWFSHATLTGPLTPLIRASSGQPSFGTLAVGAGFVGFGGMTTTNFESPQPNATNLRNNIITYISGGIVAAPPAPVLVPALDPIALGALALLLALGSFAALRRRR
jgi:hypothetical protein